MKRILFVLSVAASFFTSSCEKVMIGDVPDNSYESNFQEMWDKYDSHYGLFLVKGINWDSLHRSYLPQAHAVQTDMQLFEVMTEMLSILNDKHVAIYPTDPSIPVFNAGYDGAIPAQEDFYFPVIKEHYLSSYTKLTEEIGFGTLPDNIGYIHISAFKDDLKAFEEYMHQIVNDLKDTRGIVFDVRNHSGGSDHISKYVAGVFCSSKKLFMTTKKRNGPNHDDFERSYEWFVEPDKRLQYPNPVMLLTSSYTISAGETFTLAMRENGSVTHIGDTTAGAFSDEIFFELMNGWLYSISVGDYRASDGNSYEGIGIAPTFVSVDTRAELLNNQDITLEYAISRLK